ncbi:hypothetical protein HII12_001559 [Brettanomyces bruxellensis]|uniref:Uncharacterized protein n=1 Tax=Dekkera bruxellensis TaxID=5007 RepID=A0A8H6BKS5_DEKBR|nr:hypothetical protein HII12_001559 [Brettanomyces bruxellensis]
MYSASNSTESSQSSELLRSLVRAITNTNETLKLIHQDLAVKRLDPEKIRKTVKESVVPAIHFLRDEDGQCSPMVFIRYLSELRSALKDYGYEQVCANFAEQKYDSVSDEEELFTNETLKQTNDGSVYVMLRDYYRKSHGNSLILRPLQKKLRYEDYTKPFLDYFNLIDDFINAIKSDGYKVDDDDILEALKPGVVKLCENDRNELNQVTTLTEFKEWIIKEVKIQRVPNREEVQIPKYLLKGLYHSQTDSSGTHNKQKQYSSKHGQSKGQSKGQSQSKKDSPEKKNVHNFNLNNHNVISDLELLGGVPMSESDNIQSIAYDHSTKNLEGLGRLIFNYTENLLSVDAYYYEGAPTILSEDDINKCPECSTQIYHHDFGTTSQSYSKVLNVGEECIQLIQIDKLWYIPGDYNQFIVGGGQMAINNLHLKLGHANTKLIRDSISHGTISVSKEEKK